jgi:hypothetical protein
MFIFLLAKPVAKKDTHDLLLAFCRKKPCILVIADGLV